MLSQDFSLSFRNFYDVLWIYIKSLKFNEFPRSFLNFYVVRLRSYTKFPRNFYEAIKGFKIILRNFRIFMDTSEAIWGHQNLHKISRSYTTFRECYRKSLQLHKLLENLFRINFNEVLWRAVRSPQNFYKVPWISTITSLKLYEVLWISKNFSEAIRSFNNFSVVPRCFTKFP